MISQKSEVGSQKSTPPTPPLLKGDEGGLLNEKGIALVMVLVLSALALAIMSALIYMLVAGTQTTGIQKRYKSALEAGLGGGELTFQLIGIRGESSGQTAFLNSLQNAGIGTAADIIKTPAACNGTSGSATYTGFTAKLMTGTSTWSGACNSSITIDPEIPTSYDMVFDLGIIGTTYRVYAKIVDTVEGNTGGDTGLWKSGVVSASTGEVAAQTRPYLYTIEMVAENPYNPDERSKLSVLYQY